MLRSQGERIRIQHALERMLACVRAVDLALKSETVIGADAGAAVMQTAIEINNTLVKIDAYERAEMGMRMANAEADAEALRRKEKP